MESQAHPRGTGTHPITGTRRLLPAMKQTDHDEFDMKMTLRRPLADKAVMRGEQSLGED